MTHSVHLSTKKDSWRLCVDYRTLNENFIKDTYPIPRIENNLDVDLSDLIKGHGYRLLSNTTK